MRSRISSTRLFDAASTSITSSDVPSATATQLSHTPHGSPSAPRFGAVHRLREDARGGGLARAARPGEEVRVADTTLAHRVAQRDGDVLLTDQIGEPLGSVLPVQGLVGHELRL